MNLDLSQLEPLPLQDGAALGIAQVQAAIAYSQAVSLRRIADALTAGAAPVIHDALDDSVFTFTRSFAGDEPAEEKPRSRVKANRAPVALPDGFDTWANEKADAPVDRNLQVQTFHANGKRLKNFAGSVNWLVPEDDPWRVTGFRVIGDGAEVVPREE